MILIVAKNYRHAKFCAHEEGIPDGEWKYAQEDRDFRGVSGEVIFYETWMYHPNALRISEEVKLGERVGRFTTRNH